MRKRLTTARRVPLLILAAVLLIGAVLATVRVVRQRRETALFEAVVRRDIGETRRLLTAGANPNAPQTVRLYRETGGGPWQRALRFVLPSRYDTAGISQVFPSDAALPVFDWTGNDKHFGISADAEERHVLLALLPSHGANPSAHGPRQNPPLLRAVLGRDSASIRMLLNHGADTEAAGVADALEFVSGGNEPTPPYISARPQDMKGVTPLMYAAEHCDLPIVATLLAHRADPNARIRVAQRLYTKPFTFGLPTNAAMRRLCATSLPQAQIRLFKPTTTSEIMRHLPTSRAERTVLPCAYLLTTLITSTTRAITSKPCASSKPPKRGKKQRRKNSMKSRLYVVRVVPLLVLVAVIVGGAAVVAHPVVQRGRDTALFDAVYCRDVAGVQRWLALGANPNALHTIRMSPETGGPWWRRTLRFIRWSRADVKDVVRVLPMDAVLPTYRTPDENAPDVRQRREIIGLLLNYGANPNAHGPKQNPPIYRAVSNADFLTARLLLDSGANPNAAGDSEKDDFVVEKERVFTCSWPATDPPRNVTPLMLVADRGETRMAAALLARGADPNAKDSKGDTALHKTADFYSTYNNRLGVARVLLAAGANPSVKSRLLTRIYYAEPADATPADIARWTYKNRRDDLGAAKAYKKDALDFPEILRLLEAAEARRSAQLAKTSK